MALLLARKPHLLLHTPLLYSPTKPTSPFTVKSQNSSSSSLSKEPPKPAINAQPIDGSSSALDPQLKKPTSAGLGFGSSSSSSKSKSNPVSTKKNQRGRSKRASITRRTPVELPEFVSQQEGGQTTEQLKNEKAFLLGWLGLGAVILIEGIALAASGFLPEEWDKVLVKYLYPAFTPTVFLFVAGTVAYGVLKYLQNENLKSQK